MDGLYIAFDDYDVDSRLRWSLQSKIGHGDVPEVLTVILQSLPAKLTTEFTGRTPVHGVVQIRPQFNDINQKWLFKEGKAGQLLYLRCSSS